MIKVEIQANTAIKGVPVYHGDILDVDDADYRILASYQLAKPYVEEVKKEVIPQGLRKSTLVESVKIKESNKRRKNKKGGKKK